MSMKLSFEVWPNGIYEELTTVGVSINSWGDKPITWCVEKVAEYGYKGIDFFFDKFLELTDEEYEKMGDTLGPLVRSKGMEIASLGAHYLTITPK
ncbi:MAG TPA: hypothetical protein VJ553_00455, partial [Candidatus Paceibacterota bacterium]|nr:hypothetical protein [Candidatus Paceibacterota bacterium]